jgi:hypothetical protein
MQMGSETQAEEEKADAIKQQSWNIESVVNNKSLKSKQIATMPFEIHTRKILETTFRPTSPIWAHSAHTGIIAY